MPDLLGNDRPEDKSGTEKAKGRAREAAGSLTNDKGAKKKGQKEQGKTPSSGGGLGKLLGR